MKFKYKEDETIIFKKKKIFPTYSIKKSTNLFEKVLSRVLNKKKYKKKIFIENYNILTIALEDFLWQFCFQYIKYEKFIKKEGINLRSIKSKKIAFIDGYGRVRDYLKGNLNFKNLVIFFCKNCYFYFWIIINVLTNKNKIWIDRKFNDMRYVNLKLNKSHNLKIPYSLQSFRFENYDIETALVSDAEAKLKNYKKWMFAIKVLKPRKIMLTDNLYDNFSLLLAAKLTKTECVAISHAPTLRNHVNIMGSKLLKKDLLLFDKIFVYHKIFKELMLKHGTFYKKNQIEVIKWPNTNKYNFKIKKNNKNIYVLYPFEHFCNFKKINNFLLFLQRKNHKICRLLSWTQ